MINLPALTAVLVSPPVAVTATSYLVVDVADESNEEKEGVHGVTC